MICRTSIFFALVFIFSFSALAEDPQLEVFFSPHGGCTAAIVREIQTAKESIKVQAYGFSSAPIAVALVSAKSRGVVVIIILDRSNNSARYSQASVVSKAGIDTRIDSKHGIAHNKVIIIDSHVVITGSFNFSDNAEKNNAENLLIIRNKPMAEKYLNNFNDHSGHSEALKGRVGYKSR